MPPEDPQTDRSTPEAPPPSRADRLVAGRSGSGAGRWWLIGGGAVVVIAAVLAFVLLRGGGSGGPAPITPSPIPSRAAFTFPAPKVSAVSMGKGGVDQAGTIAAKVQLALSDYYDFAFLDPGSWAGTTPEQAWAAFSSGSVQAAKDDATSLTLAAGGGKIADLKVANSALEVKILFDAHGQPLEAIATVSFQATGTMKDGATLQVDSRGSYLLHAEGGTWRITGFPRVTTTLDAPAGG